MALNTVLRKTIVATLLVYGLSLAFSWPLAVLFGDAVKSYAGDSLWLERLSDGLNPLFFADFLPNAGPTLTVVPATLLPLILGYLALQFFVSGGLMNLFAREDDIALETFAGGAVRYGFRYLLLGLAFLPAYALTALLILLPFFLASDLLPAFPSEGFTINLALLKALLLLTGFSFLHAVQYTVRAIMAVHSSRLGWSFKCALRSGQRVFLRLWGILVLLTLVGGLAAALFAWLGVLAFGSGTLMVALLQAGVFCLAASRVWIHRTFTHFVQRNVF